MLEKLVELDVKNNALVSIPGELFMVRENNL